VIEEEPARDAWVAAWAQSLGDAADAWRPELEALIDRLGIGAGDRVLDAGCGSGRIAGWLAERVGPRGRVSGIDIEPEAVAIATDLVDPAHRRVVHLRQGEVEAIPWGADTFDAAWCSRVVGYLHDPGAALVELVRVVRPGGRIAVVAGDAARAVFLPIDPALELRIRRAMHRAWQRGAWGSPYDMHVGRRLYGLASALPVTRVEPVSLTWERTAPLSPLDRRYLAAIHAWLVDPASREWLGPDWDVCRELFEPDSPEHVLDRPDLHVLQTVAAVVITV
jgi:SAM-dependent methyltransferase